MDTEDTEGICDVFDGGKTKTFIDRKNDSGGRFESARECTEHPKRHKRSLPGEASWILKKASGHE